MPQELYEDVGRDKHHPGIRVGIAFPGFEQGLPVNEVENHELVNTAEEQGDQENGEQKVDHPSEVCRAEVEGYAVY